MQWTEPDWCTFKNDNFTVELFPTEAGRQGFDIFIRDLEGDDWKEVAEKFNEILEARFFKKEFLEAPLGKMNVILCSGPDSC
jgi:hypothetical protein